MLNHKKDFKIKGQLMLITVLLFGGIMVAASIIAGYLMLLKIRQSSNLTSSAKAIFAADAGIEWDLYERFKDDPDPLKKRYPNPPTFTNGATVNVLVAPSSTKSIGTHNNVSRAFEISYGP